MQHICLQSANTSNYPSETQIDQYLFPNIRIAIIIPAYNEEYTIKTTIQRINRNLSPFLDIIVINDGSKDNTSKIVRSFSDVTLISHLKNLGNGSAVRTGFYYCKRRSFDVIITMDADGQHDPADIPALIDKIINQKFDFVIGNRFKYQYYMPTARKFFSILMSKLYTVLFLKKITDPSNGFRAMSKKVIKELDLNATYSTIQEVLFRVMPFYKFAEIPILISQRTKGKSFIKFGKYFIKTSECFIKYFIFKAIRNPRKFIKAYSQRLLFLFSREQSDKNF
ncbi:glycosyltransferase family 2 protein [Candidatus Harpocratesius sp.]